MFNRNDQTKVIEKRKFADTKEISEAEKLFTIHTIKEEDKFRDYLYNEGAINLAKSTQYEGSRSGKQTRKSLISQYWKTYSESYKNFNSDSVKIRFHPDITEDDFVELETELIKINPNSVLWSLVTTCASVFAYNAWSRRLKAGLGDKRISAIAMMIGVVPMASYPLIKFRYQQRLNRMCVDKGWVEKYQIRKMDAKFS